jgi:serine protease Do
MNTPKLLIAFAFLCTAFATFGAAVTNREAAVRADRATMEKDARWIYNDIARGLTEAKWKSKPLLVVLRCVPCLSCAGIDASVLSEPSLAPLLDKFVCVRVINANALDLSIFQFDYDLSFSTLFMNGDGTIYGRYGSWTHQKNPADKTTAGYRAAIEGALAIHRQYPENKAGLAGKQGAPAPFKSPIEIPELAAKYKRELDWEGKVVQSCVHCHQIGEAMRSFHRAQKKPVPLELIYPMPAPETIGLTLAADKRATIASVALGSIADKAGLKAGDEFISLAGQPPLSIADVSWVLHRAPESGRLPALVLRDGKQKQVDISLPAGWRTRSDISRRVGTWQMRAMTSGGLVLEDLADETRTSRGIAADKMALMVKSVGQYGKHAAARNAGFKKDDLIVEFAGRTDRVTEGEFMGQMLQKHLPGEKVKAAVLRGGQRVELMMPMQ